MIILIKKCIKKETFLLTKGNRSHYGCIFESGETKAGVGYLKNYINIILTMV